MAVCPDLQGRVMTSSARGAGGPELRLDQPRLHRSRTAGRSSTTTAARIASGSAPKAASIGLYFPPGKPFDVRRTGRRRMRCRKARGTSRTQKPASVTFKKSMTLTNWSDTPFTVDVTRTAELVSRADAQEAPRPRRPGEGRWLRRVRDEEPHRERGQGAWKKDKGLVSIWILAMFAPVPDARVIVPFETGPDVEGPIVNDAYFGKVPADRLEVRARAGFLVFKCDGKHRSKIGLGPRARRTCSAATAPRPSSSRSCSTTRPEPDAPLRQQHVGEAEGAVRGRRRQQLQRRFARAGQAAARRLLRDRDELARRGARAGPAARAHASHVPLRRRAAALDPIAQKMLGVSLDEIRTALPAPVAKSSTVGSGGGAGRGRARTLALPLLAQEVLLDRLRRRLSPEDPHVLRVVLRSEPIQVVAEVPGVEVVEELADVAAGMGPQPPLPVTQQVAEPCRPFAPVFPQERRRPRLLQPPRSLAPPGTPIPLQAVEGAGAGVGLFMSRWGLGIQAKKEEVGGLLILAVVPKSPAAEAGLEQGDSIQEVDGKSPESPAALSGDADSKVNLKIKKKAGDLVLSN